MLTGDMLRRSAERFPDKIALIHEDARISYGALDADANRCANALLALGLGKGDHVAILCRNRPEYVTAFFGAARSGVVLVNVSVLYSSEELAWVLDNSDAVALLYEDCFAEKVHGILPRLDRLKHLVAVGSGDGKAASFDAFLDGHSDARPSVVIEETDPFCITYTGGTTGRPKGVLADHRSRAITAHTVVVEGCLDEDDVVAIVTPLFHVAALNIMLQPAVLVGATTVLMGKWDVREFARLSRTHKITAGFMVPTQLIMIVNDGDFDAADYGTWRKVNFSGAPMPDWVQVKLREELPDLALTQFYGQSEVGILAALKPRDLPGQLGSVGRRVFNTDLELVDPDGKPVPRGAVGEIVGHGPNVMIEYYNAPDQTREFRRFGWAWTGDLGIMDEAGFLRLVDRSKDMIISGGENIYPKEIEDVLYEHEAVAECAVFGIPDDKWGEVPVAYVQLKPGMEVEPEALADHCADRVARFKRPRLVKIVNDFPKTAIGKIQKNLLRAPYWTRDEAARDPSS